MIKFEDIINDKFTENVCENLKSSLIKTNIKDEIIKLNNSHDRGGGKYGFKHGTITEETFIKCYNELNLDNKLYKLNEIVEWSNRLDCKWGDLYLTTEDYVLFIDLKVATDSTYLAGCISETSYKYFTDFDIKEDYDFKIKENVIKNKSIFKAWLCTDVSMQKFYFINAKSVKLNLKNIKMKQLNGESFICVQDLTIPKMRIIK
jgi:hypothetical protein